MNSSLLFPETNTTILRQAAVFDYVQAVSYGVVGLLTLVFNGFALIVILRWKDTLEETTRIMFQTMAVTNLVIGVVATTFEGPVFFFGKGATSFVICQHIPFMVVINMLTLCFHTCTINVQRYLSIMYPFRYAIYATPRNLYVTCILLKVLFVAYSVVFIPFAASPIKQPATAWCLTKSVIVALDPGICDVTCRVTFAFVGVLLTIPFVVITVVNTRLAFIARRISKHGNAVSGISSKVNSSVRSRLPSAEKAGTKGLGTVLVINGLFYLSIMPRILIIALMVVQSLISAEVFDSMYFVSSILLLCSCWWNVPVYMSTNKIMKRRCISILMMIKCWTPKNKENSTSVVTVT